MPDPMTPLLIVRVALDAEAVYPLGSIVQFTGDEPPEGWIVYPHGEPIPDEHAALRAVFGGDRFPDFRGKATVTEVPVTQAEPEDDE